MLTNLLPGLRELRAPLISGAMWLVSAWLLLGSRIPERSVAPVAWSQLYRLIDAVGRPFALAALALIAYVVGVLSWAFSQRIDRTFAWVVGRVRASYSAVRNPFASPDRLVLESLRRFVTEELEKRFDLDDRFAELLAERWQMLGNTIPVPAPTSSYAPFAAKRARAKRLTAMRQEPNLASQMIEDVVDVDMYVRHIVWDRNRLLPQLAVVSPEAFNLVDRELSEADFRQGIVLPLSGLLLVLSLQFSPWWLLGLLVCPPLLRLGFLSREKASSFMYGAIAAGHFDVATVRQLLAGPVQLKP